MDKVKSIEQYKELKDAAKKRSGRLSTNCLLTASGIEELINLGTLYYCEYDAGLVLYSDEQEYYRAFYWLNEDAPLPDMHQDKLVSIEELDGSDGRRAGYLQRFFGKLEDAGWEKIARNLYVERLLAGAEEFVTAEYEAGRQRLEEQGLRIEFCRPEHANRVIELWRGYLHGTDIPAEHLGFMDDESQRVVCVLNEEDFVCAVNWWQFKGGRCETRHIVTDPGYYQRGIAYVLQMAAVYDAIQAGCRSVFTYIDEVNYRSLALFKKVGIVPNGRVTYQYGLRGEQ